VAASAATTAPPQAAGARLVGQLITVGWGAWTDSDMQGGPVDELWDAAVERPALDPLEIEGGRALEDRVQSGLPR
jgi:hypothetical protein